MGICDNIAYGLENISVCIKEIPTYKEGDMVYIEFKTGKPDLVGKGEGGDIGVQRGVTNGITNVL